MKRIILGASLLLLMFSFQSCAVAFLGRAVGKGIDHGNFKESRRSHIKTVNPWELDWGGSNLVEVHLKDSVVITGKFNRYLREPNEEYNSRYEIFRNTLPAQIIFPDTGCVLTIVKSRKNAKPITGKFTAFNKDKLEISNGKSSYRKISTDKIGLLMDSTGYQYDLAETLGEFRCL